MHSKGRASGNAADHAGVTLLENTILAIQGMDSRLDEHIARIDLYLASTNSPYKRTFAMV